MSCRRRCFRSTTGTEYDQLVQRVMNNEIIRGKLLSEDGQLTLIVLALDPDVVASSRLRDVIGEIQKTIHDDLAGTQPHGPPLRGAGDAA
jgi:hypothetical protein